MTSPDKPREFWLNERLERIYKDSDASCPDDEIHVIEKSAYDKLAAQLAEAKDSIVDLVESEKKCIAANIRASRKIDQLHTDKELLVEALKAWVDWENGQIEKEGPYVGKRINELISHARQALEKVSR